MQDRVQNSMQTDRFSYYFFSDPFKYDHYGEIYNRVDMRAEVGLMTRNILIDAEVSEGNSNGGHVKVKNTTANHTVFNIFFGKLSDAVSSVFLIVNVVYSFCMDSKMSRLTE